MLEDAITKLAAAVEANTAAVQEQITLIRKGVAKAEGKASDAPATKAEAKPKTKPKKDAMTKEAFLKRFGDYLSLTEDEDEIAERKKNIRPILAEFDAKKVSELAEENWPAALAQLDKLVEEASEPGGGDDDDVI